MGYILLKCGTKWGIEHVHADIRTQMHAKARTQTRQRMQPRTLGAHEQRVNTQYSASENSKNYRGRIPLEVVGSNERQAGGSWESVGKNVAFCGVMMHSLWGMWRNVTKTGSLWPTLARTFFVA